MPPGPHLHGVHILLLQIKVGKKLVVERAAATPCPLGTDCGGSSSSNDADAAALPVLAVHEGRNKIWKVGFDESVDSGAGWFGH